MLLGRSLAIIYFLIGLWRLISLSKRSSVDKLTWNDANKIVKFWFWTYLEPLIEVTLNKYRKQLDVMDD